MRLKLSRNSLFAILLRSPWWISLAVALVMAAASRALLPAQYWVFGAIGAIPFVGIAVIALYRQLRKPGARRTQAVLQAVRAMSWREFSQALEDAFARDGYRVERLQGAADLSLARDGRTTLVAAKRWKAARQGEEAVAGLHAQMRSRDASACTWIALGELSGNAQAFARAHGVEVMQEEQLVQLLRGLQLPGR